MSRLTIIVAATKSNGIGQNSQLPWRLAKEMAYFARVTSNAPAGNASNAVVMGRNTWESIPQKFRPLRNRVNIVLTRANASLDFGAATIESNLQAAIARASSEPRRTFLIGGASLYAEGLALPPSSSGFVDRVLLTRILSPAFDGCDVFMPDFLGTTDWTRATHGALQEWVGFEVAEGVQEENGVQYEFQMWVRDP